MLIKVVHPTFELPADPADRSDGLQAVAAEFKEMILARNERNAKLFCPEVSDPLFEGILRRCP